MLVLDYARIRRKGLGLAGACLPLNLSWINVNPKLTGAWK